jgi:hypothetical protein
MLPFVFSALTLNAVGRAAFAVVEEVRRQFRDIPGLKDGEPGVKPDYAKCVDMTTKTAVYEMLLPGSIAIIAPLLIGRFLGIESLAGFLAGALACGFIMAIFMANAGGAWDNAKKYIEGGELGGKGTPTHAAAVVGDTVGDPFKDTAARHEHPHQGHDGGLAHLRPALCEVGSGLLEVPFSLLVEYPRLGKRHPQVPLSARTAREKTSRHTLTASGRLVYTL